MCRSGCSAAQSMSSASPEATTFLRWWYRGARSNITTKILSLLQWCRISCTKMPLSRLFLARTAIRKRASEGRDQQHHASFKILVMIADLGSLNNLFLNTRYILLYVHRAHKVVYSYELFYCFRRNLDKKLLPLRSYICIIYIITASKNSRTYSPISIEHADTGC